MARYLPFACAILLLLPPTSVSATTQRLEAETYYNYGQITGCGLNISIVPCSEASAGYAVDGVDCDGEWIKLHLSVGSVTPFFTALRTAGAVGYIRTFRIDYLTDPLETPVASVTLVTVPGSGVS